MDEDGGGRNLSMNLNLTDDQDARLDSSMRRGSASPQLRPSAAGVPSFGVSIGVSSFVRPVITGVVVDVAENGDRAVTVLGNYLPDKTCVVEFNGLEFEADVLSSGVSLSFTIPPSKWQASARTAVVVRAVGVDSATYRSPLVYTRVPQIWSASVAGARDTLLIKGVNLELAKGGGITVIVDGAEFVGTLTEEGAVRASVPWASIERKVIAIRVIVSGVTSMPFMRDLTQWTAESVPTSSSGKSSVQAAPPSAAAAAASGSASASSVPAAKAKATDSAPVTLAADPSPSKRAVVPVQKID